MARNPTVRHGKRSGSRLRIRPLVVTYQRINQLKPNPRNPRIHTPRQIAQIAASIQTFGFVNPVLVNAKGEVIAGHGRLLAAGELGWSEVPTIALAHLTPAQVRAYRIADNRLTENSEWDKRLLGESLKLLGEADLDFEIEITGFETAEIDLLIEGLAPAPGEGEPDPADVVPEPTGAPVTRLGDLWELGPNRVICGDALAGDSYHALLDDARADLVFSDPPYNLEIPGCVSGLGKHTHGNFVMGSGEMSEAEFTGFLETACRNLVRYSRPGSLHFLFMDWRHAWELLSAARANYAEYKALCIWAKTNAGMGSLYRNQHELVFVFKNGTARHRNNIELGRFGRYRSNLWSYTGMNTFAREGENGNLLQQHPTVKPVALVADAILDATRRGDLVLDAFLGSGTTLIAAERTGRVGYGIELEPRFVDVAIRRWEAFTGGEAKHATRRRTFREIAAERGVPHE